MNWEVVKPPENRRGKNLPYASVGFGRLSLSAAACELIEDHRSITHVELLRGKLNNNLCIRAIYFLYVRFGNDGANVQRCNLYYCNCFAFVIACCSFSCSCFGWKIFATFKS